MKTLRPPLAAAFTAAAICAAPAHAAPPGDAAAALVPSTVFLQAGAANDVRSYVAGATLDFAWRADIRGATARAYLETSFGRWIGTGDSSGSTAWVTQIGVTPVLRLYLDSAEQTWFVEAGIGANMLTPLYRSNDKRFSTAFNFGDHLAFGRRFGTHGRHDIALRYEHFSNGGVKRPNPGEDFVQLRWSVRVAGIAS